MEWAERLCRRVKEELSFTGSPPGELLAKLSKEEGLRSAAFLSTFSAIPPEALSETWSEEAVRFAKKSGLTEEETAFLVQFGRQLGTTDVFSQQEHCERSGNWFSAHHDQAAREFSQKGRLYPTLGAVSGVAVALLLL